MSDETKEIQEEPEAHSSYQPADARNEDVKHQLTGMYQRWFLDYASYVILERAVPHLGDGLKPVQRRILHTMKRLDDGRYSKVANIVGQAMQFHPHGDASIGDALVQLGQKDLLIDCQGNWGNILTGDGAAAPRYIEARLSKFALDVLFNPKTTEWKLSYDGRNKEPVSLPVKFPLLLAQGAEGIAVGLSAKILPHNFGELCDAAISYLHGEEFHLYPDFLTGGSIDVSRYNNGLRGGAVKVRATIEKLDSKTLAIREIPYGKTTSSVIDSILKANEKGKIKIRKVDDNTAAEVEILVHLTPGTSSDKAIDALYAFTDCEVSISPNCCVIDEKRPKFLTVSDVLRRSVDNTQELLRRELLIRRGELMESLHFASLERIFIEERIYKDRPFEQAKDMDAACAHIDERLTPYYPQFVREVTKEDILRLMEIRMARILKFNKDKAEELIARMKDEVARIDRDLGNMVEVTANWFRLIREKYAHEHPRRTVIRALDAIEATKVIEANEKLYINRADGFMGTGLKKDEFVENCSPIDDVIIFYRDGTYKVTRVQDKVFIGETERSRAEKRKAEVIHIAVFKKNDKRTIYNVVYRDGKNGPHYIKRFNVTAITHDREYDLTTGTPGSRVTYFTPNPNGEAEVIKVTLKPNPKLRRIFFDKDFGEILVKGRQSRGNLLTKLDVHRVTLKAHGASTLGGRKVWFDHDVQRLNYDERGQYLGEFHTGDAVLIVLDNGDFYTTNFDPANHYEATGILRVEKFDENTVWTAVLFDADQQGFPYVKRFTFERTAQTRHLNFMGENNASRFVLLTDTPYPRLLVTYGGADAFREPLEVDAETFIGAKSFKAKGKRLTTCAIEKIEELEPLRKPEPEDSGNDGEDSEEDEETTGGDNVTEDNPNDIIDEITGQMRLF
ncbi:DNA gyrase subunit A [Bacteroidaceae bacterium]|uniref:DNA gyrase/topoisomerase IV subunit A n=1 Tax=Prevotella sp. MGM2 TaxID=2033406 RepID=UPI000CEA476A|nr:DNA gyrase/topoisomerase IV subunit A [Prevotella sp. MGM2]GAY29727.1 dNA topoisomerase IV subunit A [Prevotella sp. MGM2]GFI34753.1 DNA gyrase subunit A [Bacteroidaceae bacterium]